MKTTGVGDSCCSAAFATIESLEESEIVPPAVTAFPIATAKPVNPMLQVLNCVRHPIIDVLRELHIAAFENYPYLEDLTQVVMRLTAPVDEGN